jgi:hypothetical protein
MVFLLALLENHGGQENCGELLQTGTAASADMAQTARHLPATLCLAPLTHPLLRSRVCVLPPKHWGQAPRKQLPGFQPWAQGGGGNQMGGNRSDMKLGAGPGGTCLKSQHWEAKAAGSGVRGQLGLHSETLSPKAKQHKTKNYK